MAKAKIETPSGAKILIEGTKDEINSIISDYQRRENMFKQRGNYYNYISASGANITSKYNEEIQQTPFLGERKQVSPNEKVQELIKAGFFSRFRKLSDVREEIRNKSKVFIRNSSLHPTLMSFINKGILARLRGEDGLWYYSNKKEEENVKK